MVPQCRLPQAGCRSGGEETVEGESKNSIHTPHKVQTRHDLLLQLTESVCVWGGGGTGRDWAAGVQPEKEDRVMEKNRESKCNIVKDSINKQM